MRILIVDDNPNKRIALNEFLVRKFENAEIVMRYSYNSGLVEIIEGRYDVVLLDMSMPSFDLSAQEAGGSPRPFAGKEILKQMVRRKIMTPVIVVTQFEVFGEGTSAMSMSELSFELNRLFEDIYIGAVYYNASQKNWKEQLEILIKEYFRGESE